MRILLVDDDENLMESLAERLIQQRYAVDIAVDGSSAETYVDLFDYDLIVLDLMLPDGDGIQFAKQFREEGFANPLMILTAKESTAEKVKALDAGADDYVVKPFDFDELCARIRALLRREHQGLPAILSWGPLRLDPSACETTYKDNSVRLTPKEFSMMELFLRHPHRVYSLGAIIDDLWSFEDPPGEDAVRTHIKGLRRKLRKAGAPKDLIKTVYGLGYRLNENTAWPTDSAVRAEGGQLAEARLSGGPADQEQPDQEQLNKEQLNKEQQTGLGSAASYSREIVQPRRAIDADPSAGYSAGYLADESSGHSSDQSSGQSSGQSAMSVAAADSQMRLKQQLANAGRRYLFSAGAQISTLEKVVQSLVQGFLEPVLYQEGLVCAHQLSGSLGSFGFVEGSRTARQIEAFLRSLSLQPQLSASIELSTQLTPWVQSLRQSIDQAVDQATDPVVDRPLDQVEIPDAANVLLMVTEDKQLSEQLVMSAAQQGFQSQIVTTLLEATAILQSIACDVVLLDVQFELTAELSTFIQTISADNADGTPLIAVMGTQLDLSARLALSRYGVSLVSDRTAPPLQIMQAVAHVARVKKRPVQIAIALADPSLRARLNTQLTSQGFQVIPFESAAALWQGLALDPEQSTADILLLEIELSKSPNLLESHLDNAHIKASHLGPSSLEISSLEINGLEINGLDLCRIIRADSHLQAIPVVFLTHQPEAQPESQLEAQLETDLYTQVYQAGGNDCIRKSVDPDALAIRLHSQLTFQDLTKISLGS